MTGRIFDIKRFALHDGDGIRSTLFFSGCPLSCVWCQNPEGLAGDGVVWRSGSCISCGGCRKHCKHGAISDTPTFFIDRTLCKKCGECEKYCPTSAITFSGERITADRAAALLLRDKVFFLDGGGVTLSGGEVLAQPDFAVEILEICKNEGVDTAIETCLYAKTEQLRRFIPLTDTFIVDLKIFDEERHRKFTGVDPTPIRHNYNFLYESGVNMLTRVPIIPGFTDDDDNIRDIAKFIVSIDNDLRTELLPYNPLCRSKYDSMGLDYPVRARKFNDSSLPHLRKLMADEGLHKVFY